MKFLTGLVVFLSLLVFSSVFISPEVFPYAGLLPFLIPVALLVNLFLFFVLALAWRRLAFFPLLCMAIGYKFFLITVQLHPKNEAATGLKVLTYNARLFNYKNPPAGTDESSVFSWLNEHPAEIKVIPHMTLIAVSSSSTLALPFRGTCAKKHGEKIVVNAGFQASI